MIYLVTGFMRSGTSALMQGLKSGGMPIFYSKERDNFNNVHSSEAYKPNPESLFETIPEDLTVDNFKINQSKALKLVAPLIDRLPIHDYRAVVIHRDPEEIRQSLEAAFGICRSLEFIEGYTNHLVDTLYNRRDVRDVIEIQHQDLIFKPKEIFTKINWPFDKSKAADIISPGLYRFRKEHLVVGL